MRAATTGRTVRRRGGLSPRLVEIRRRLSFLDALPVPNNHPFADERSALDAELSRALDMHPWDTEPSPEVEAVLVALDEAAGPAPTRDEALATLTAEQRAELVRCWQAVDDDCDGKHGYCAGKRGPDGSVVWYDGRKAYLAWRRFYNVPDDLVPPRRLSAGR